MSAPCVAETGSSASTATPRTKTNRLIASSSLREQKCRRASLVLCVLTAPVRRSLGHPEPDPVVPAGSIGQRGYLFFDLQLTRAVRRPHAQRVITGTTRRPDHRPQHPGVWPQRRLELRGLPGLPIVDGHLDRLDAAVASVGDTSQWDFLPYVVHHVTPLRACEFGHRLDDGLLAPAGPLPLPQDVGVQCLNFGNPLRVLHAEVPRHEQTDWESVFGSQG